MNYEGFLEKLRKLIIKPNELSPSTKKALQFKPNYSWPIENIYFEHQQ